MSSALNQQFKYTAHISANPKLLKVLKINSPRVSEVVFHSHIFTSLAQCSTSCETFLYSLRKKLRGQYDKIDVAVETNPRYSSTETFSSDWEEDEIGRMWMFESETGDPIAEAKLCFVDDETQNLH